MPADRDPFTDKTYPKYPETEEGPGMFVSSDFWIGGALSVCVWAALFWWWLA